MMERKALPSRRAVLKGAGSLLPLGVAAPALGQSRPARVLAGGGIDVRAFGAVGDGKADDTAAIQAAVDYAIRSRVQTVHLPEGTYRTTDTLHLGYGVGHGEVSEFTTLDLVGQGRANYAGATAGALLVPERVDRPAINIQGGRNCRIAGLALKGRFQGDFIRGFAGFEAILPAERTAWLDRAKVPDGLARFAPYAAITIDGYAGVRPERGYPDVRYPDWLGAQSRQYGKAYSSACTIEECHIEGFAVGIANQPGNSDGNADFTRIRNSHFACCVHAIAICNSQSRNVEIRNNNFLCCHTFLTTGYFGAAVGQLGGPIENNSGSRSYQIVDVPNAGYSGNVELRANYAEELARIGVWGRGASSRAGRVTFSNCHFHFVGTMMPRALLECGTTTAPVFQSCFFAGLRRMPHLVLGGSGLVIDNCVWDAGRDYTGQDDRGSSPRSDAMARAYSSFGGLATTQAGLGNAMELRGVSEGISLGLGAASRRSARQFTAELRLDDYRAPVIDHPGARWLVDANGRRWAIVWRPVPVTLAKQASVFPRLPTQSGMRLTGSYAAERQASSGMSGAMEAGNLLCDVPTGNLFVVIAVSLNQRTGHYDFEAELHNNYNIVGGVQVPSEPIGEAGNMLLIKTGIVVPTTVYWGDFSAGRVEVTNVHRGDGRAVDLAGDLYVGMWVASDGNGAAEAGSGVAANTRVSAIKPGVPGSVTLDRPAVASGRFALLPVGIARG